MNDQVQYMVTASGQDYALNGATLGAPRVEDIAHHLAQINRFTGACVRPYSVNEHSLLCDDIARDMGWPPTLRRAVFSHDWHEAYTSDVSSPVKCSIARMTDALTLFERRHAGHIRREFNVSDWNKYESDVRFIDLTALATERRDLLPPAAVDSRKWKVIENVRAWEGVDLMSLHRRGMRWDDWRDMFLGRYRELWPA